MMNSPQRILCNISIEIVCHSEKTTKSLIVSKKCRKRMAEGDREDLSAPNGERTFTSKLVNQDLVDDVVFAGTGFSR
jgi:hypothetical protein